MTDNIRRTHLIQRLNAPTGFVEGFGTVTLLSKYAKEILKYVCEFDYMGSSEFEFGSVPRTFERITQYCKDGKATKGNVQLEKNILYLCERDCRNYVEDTITKLAEDEYRHFRLQEPCRLRDILEGNKYFDRLKGWLEMNNNFMFFVDQEMAEKFYTIFNVKNNK
jgi:hypothetical protein